MSAQREPETSTGRSASLTARLLAAWMLVGVPLVWGVWQVFRKSLDLFH